MRRIAVLAGVCAALAILAIAPAGASAAFTQCPAVDKDTSCQFLVTVTNGGLSIAEDPTQHEYEGSDDALIGVQNSSSSPVSSIHLSAENELFGFEFDGICSVGPPIAPGCKVQPETPEHFKSIEPPGTECAFAGEFREGKEVKTTVFENCAFNPPAGEPAGLVFPAGVAPIAIAANGDQVSGYEGPTSWFTNIGPIGFNTTGSGTINFSPAIPPGGSTYFSLESPPVGGFGTASSLTTTLSGGGQAGPSINVPQGTAVTDSATLGGLNAATATGEVAYNIYSDAQCSHLVVAAGSKPLAGGAAGPSNPANLPVGVYYWQASYGGDANNKPVSSACGGEVLTVQAPTTTSTVQSGGGVSGPSIPLILGATVTDQAHIAGAQAASATGTVAYTLWSDSKCTKALASSAGAVTGGLGAPSIPIKPTKTGTYYWTASYSGAGLNAPSSSPCGSEILIVSKKGNIFPKGFGKKCLSKRAFAIHPRFARGAKITSFKEFINGKLVKEGRLSNRATSVNLIGLPKGTYKVELVTVASNGESFEDTRTFHTCVPKKRHRHH
jgi:hypothetical protein